MQSVPEGLEPAIYNYWRDSLSREKINYEQKRWVSAAHNSWLIFRQNVQIAACLSRLRDAYAAANIRGLNL